MASCCEFSETEKLRQIKLLAVNTFRGLIYSSGIDENNFELVVCLIAR